MKKLITACLLTVLPGIVFATAQVGEILVYKGSTNEIYTTPLESFFSEETPRPDFPMPNTACWRGYIGVWQIESNTLYLASLHEVDTDRANWLGNKIPLDKIFPQQKLPIPASWFSGILVLPHGELVNYVHMGFGSTYSNYTLFEVNKGQAGKVKELTTEQYDEFRDRQFSAFKKTEEYKKLIEKMNQDGYAPEGHDDFLRNFITQYTSKFLVE